MIRSVFRTLMVSALVGLVSLATTLPAEAQGTGSIRGRVTETGTERPLEGAEVFLEGRVRAVVTDGDGQYVITNVPTGVAVIRVRLIGYGAAGMQLTVISGQTAEANFSIGRSAISLDEIVVTGQGREVERRKLTAPVNVINAEEIAAAPVTDLAQLLQGKIAGATVSATSAQGGTSGLINFRGVSSVFGSQTPVIYVDGVRVDNSEATASGTGGEQSSALADLLITDIDRVEVTKGGAASTLYGSDASSGVIQIFTKRGTPGAPRVTARIEQGVDVPELRYMFDTGLIYPDEIEDGADPDFLKNNFFQSGHFQNYYLNVTGGREDLTYSLSGRIQQADGVQLKNENEIFNLRGSMQADVSSKLGVNFTGAYTRSKFGRLYNGTAIADPLTSFEVGDVFFFTGEENFPDALDRFLLPDIDETVNRFLISSGANYRASELFSGRATLGLDYRTNQQREFSPIGTVFISGGEGQLQRFQRDKTLVTLDLAGTVSWPRDGFLTSDFTFGAQGFRDDVAITNVTGTSFALPGAPDFDEAATVTATEGNTEIFNGGFYFQEEIGLGDRLYLQAGLRLDANSAFGDDVSVEAYPKLGAAYVVSDEEIFQNTLGAVLNTLKLRAAYGQTGKFPTPFSRDRSFNASQFRGESAPRFANPGNLNLAPEVTSTVEVGFDMAAIDNRIGVGFTYYDAETNDALFDVPEQDVTGLGTQLRNVGTISNKGIEVELDLSVLNSSDVRWDLGATYQAVKNRVTNLGGASPFFVEGAQQRVDDGCFPEPAPCSDPVTNEPIEGLPVGAWYVNTPIDTNGDGLNDGFERQFTGKSPIPTKSGSFSTRVTLFNSLTITGTADWATGHEAFDWGSIWATFNGIYRRELVDFEDANGNGIRDTDADGNYTETGFNWPIRYDTDGNEIGPYSQNQARSAVVVKGDWIKLREVGVRWNMPESLYQRLGFDRAILYGSLRNAKIWSSNPMIDPELNGLNSGGNLTLGGESSVTLSPPHSWRFGLEVVF